MTIESADVLNTTRFQDGQPDNSISEADVRVAVDSAAGAAGATVTASFNFAASHRGKIIEGNHGSTPITGTITTGAAFEAGTVLGLCQIGAAAVSFVAGSGVTFIPAGVSASCRAVGSEVFARHSYATANTWIISGDYS